MEKNEGRTIEWQNPDSKKGGVQSSCLIAVLFLGERGGGLDGGWGGGEWVLVLCRQAVYFKLQSVVPAGEQGWDFIFSKDGTLLLQYWRMSYWATKSSKQTVSPNYKKWIEHLLLNVTSGNRISMPSVDKLYLICLLFVLERKDLIQMSIKSIFQLEGTSDCLLRRALKERKKKMEG